MRFPIPSSVTYAFAEGSFGLRFPFGLRFVVFFVVGGRKNQDFTPLTEYPPGGVLRNDYFANGRGLGHAPGLLQIWALSGVPRALVCSVRAAVGRGAADRASVSFRGIPEGPAAGPSATLCVCTGSSSRPAAAEAHFRSVGASALLGVWAPAGFGVQPAAGLVPSCGPPLTWWGSWEWKAKKSERDPREKTDAGDLFSVAARHSLLRIR